MSMLFLKRYRIAVVACSLLLLCIADLQAQSLPDFTQMVEKYSPAVVNISTKQKPTKTLMERLPPQYQIPDLPKDSPLNDLFRHFFGVPPGRPHGRPPSGSPHGFEGRSLGSGFIISDDGYLMTNHHVVTGADEITVRLSDHREFKAEVVGSDERSDIALLKIDADNLPVVAVSRNRELKVGEWVLAIGSPFGFDHSVTQGIVSAKGRSLPSENYVPFIQTDVAINPGNSGGPLFNLDGEVVGINSQIFSHTGSFMGLSFAIPIDMAMNVVDQIKNKGFVTRGWLGVLIQDVTRELAESFGLSRPYGALVARVQPDSPSEKAGLQPGDVILTFNGDEVANSSALPPMVGAAPVDQPAEVGILRQGEQLTVKVVLGTLPGDVATKAGSAAASAIVRGNRIGVTVRELTKEERSHLGLEAEGGVLAEDVKLGPAREAGIRKGDVIQMINGVYLKDIADFKQQVESLPEGKSVAVLVYRRQGPIFLALKLPEDD
ncbi:HtrA protease/chaperone protein [hydrothermal vent metagenome]|uniref:Probable periplasmic serine endoprotease DegP-like n=1 Tax=hydrothermal vent metagenome TaxID=652676 RepID=A0A3B1BHE6_9ZZZZ